MGKKDIKILTFIYDRMINVYGEKEGYDYMTAFSKIIDKQQLTIPNVSQQRELFNAILDFSEDLPMCTEDYNRSELWEKYKSLNY
jgi:hypothetical protein